MSLDDLESDLNRNIDQLEARSIVSVEDVKRYLKETIWPFLTNVVEEVKELDGDVTDLVEQAEDILQPETAGIFATVITQCMGLAAELEKRLKPNDANDKKWAKRLAGVRSVCSTARDTLLEITVTPDEDEDQTEPLPDDTQPSDAPVPANEEKEIPDAG